MSALLQSGAVTAVVLLSMVSLLRRFWPARAWQAQARLSYWLERPGRPHIMRALGRRLRPSIKNTAPGCGMGCSSCGICIPSSIKQPLVE